MIVGSFFHPDEPRAEVQRFREAFRRRYGAAPDGGAAVGYDNVWLLARAMRQAGSVAPDEVAKALHGMAPWSGVTGRFQFDQNGSAVGRQLVKMVVRGEKFAHLGDEPPRWRPGAFQLPRRPCIESAAMRDPSAGQGIVNTSQTARCRRRALSAN